MPDSGRPKCELRGNVSGMRRITMLACLSLIAAVAIAPGSATAKKKKKTYCQKQGSSVRAKLLAKSNGFYVYREKGGATVLLCQDKPKFFGSTSWERGARLGRLIVVKKKCAIYSQLGSGNPKVYAINFADFLSRNGQASVREIGFGGSGQLLGMSLSQSCVGAYGTRVNGVPQIAVAGTSVFGYTGALYPPVSASATDKELANVRVSGTTVGAGATATVTWSEAGVPKSYVYMAQTRY